MEWSKLAIEILIESYSNESCLYNSKSTAYHNKHARKEAMARIVEALKDVRPSSINDIVAKMKSLRTTFVSELHKIKYSMKSGTGTDETYKPTIWYFHKLSFLQDHVQARRGTCSANVPVRGEDFSIIGESQIINVTSLPPDCTTAITVDEWEVPQDRDHIIQLTGASPNTPSTSGLSHKRKRAADVMEQENELLNKASSILNNVSNASAVKDDIDGLGVFVTTALRKVKNRALFLKAQKQILNVIMSIQEEDLD